MCVREGEAFNTSFWFMVSLESEDQYYHCYHLEGRIKSYSCN